MTVVLRHNEDLELNLVEYQGAITVAELSALAQFLADNHVSLKKDCLNLVLPGSDFHSVDFEALDGLFAHYRDLFAALKFQIFRRAAWICQSDASQAHVDYWLRGRDMREGMSSDVRQFDTFAEAGDWLVLNDAELGLLQRGDGFGEVVRFHLAPDLSRAAAR